MNKNIVFVMVMLIVGTTAYAGGRNKLLKINADVSDHVYTTIGITQYCGTVDFGKGSGQFKDVSAQWIKRNYSVIKMLDRKIFQFNMANAGKSGKMIDQTSLAVKRIEIAEAKKKEMGKKGKDKVAALCRKTFEGMKSGALDVKKTFPGHYKFIASQ